jgi:Mrp family chromosome partitioning ATPase
MTKKRDADDTIRHGKIITFYSFKGGVGRTMALANVAFLTALNGYRVLVMDWDLEAPGLAYYFRCLLDAPEVRALKERRGVMDVLAEWDRSAANHNAQATDLDALLARFHTGEPFAECVIP